MGPYLFLIAFLFLLYPAVRHIAIPGEKKAIVYALMAALALALLLGLRHPSMGVDLGYDTGGGYLESFQTISDLSWTEVLVLDAFQNYERGYLLLNKLIGSVSTHQQFFLLCCGLLSILPIGVMIGRYSRNCRTSFLIYLGLPAFLIAFSGLRQAIALAITFYGYRFVRERKCVRYFLTVLLACQFHSSAVVSLLVYPACRIRLDRMARYATLVLLPLLFAFRSQIWNWIVRVTGRSIPAVHSGSVNLLLLFCAVYVYMVVFSPEKGKFDGLVNLHYLACGTLVFAEVSHVAQRVGYYFMLYLTLSLPELLHTVREKWGNREYMLHLGAIAGGFLLFGFYQLRTSSWAEGWPYRFFWQAGA